MTTPHEPLGGRTPLFDELSGFVKAQRRRREAGVGMDWEALEWLEALAEAVEKGTLFFAQRVEGGLREWRKRKALRTALKEAISEANGQIARLRQGGEGLPVSHWVALVAKWDGVLEETKERTE